jgi:nucleoside 2-deoxyribosyltransferase
MSDLTQYVYVASSWRNPIHPDVVDSLRAEGIPCYDFKRDEGAQFGWHEVMPDTYVPGSETMSVGDYLGAIEHPRAIAGYASDFAAMERADTFVLVLPCGRSAHLELGWAVGAGKRTVILLDASRTVMVPELMYKMVDHISPHILDLLAWLGGTS